MTNDIETAIKIIKEDYKYCEDSNYDVWMGKRHAYKTALESFEKQTSRKVVQKVKNYSGLWVSECPNCEDRDVDIDDNYCSNCGQKISWEVKPREYE